MVVKFAHTASLIVCHCPRYCVAERTRGGGGHLVFTCPERIGARCSSDRRRRSECRTEAAGNHGLLWGHLPTAEGGESTATDRRAASRQKGEELSYISCFNRFTVTFA